VFVKGQFSLESQARRDWHTGALTKLTHPTLAHAGGAKMVANGVTPNGAKSGAERGGERQKTEGSLAKNGKRFRVTVRFGASGQPFGTQSRRLPVSIKTACNPPIWYFPPPFYGYGHFAPSFATPHNQRVMVRNYGTKAHIL